MKRNVRRIVAAVVCGIAFAAPIGASAYSQLTVFGDSLADAGNVFLFSGGNFPPPPYAQVLSNGPTAVQVLAAQLGLPLTPSLAGGRDYAFGGAETGTGNFFSVYPAVPPIINQLFSGPPNFPATGTLAQVQGFGGTLAPDGLTVLWAGPNDIFTAIFTGQDPSTVIGPAIGNLAQEVGLLYAAGARTLLVPNSPNLGLIPFGLTSGNSAGLTALTVVFNGLLAQTLAQLESTLPGLNIIEFDIFGLVDSAIANPAAYGFVNVTDPCFDGISVCANPDQYIFWDGVHPTARSHAIIGEAFAASVPEPATLALCALALAVLGVCRRRRIG